MNKPVVQVEYEPEVRFDFPKDKKTTPKNFDSLNIDDEVTVVAKGKIRSIRHDSDGRSFGMTYSKIKITIPETKVKGIADTMAEVEKERKTP